MPAPHQLPITAGVHPPQLLGAPAALLHNLLHQLLDQLTAAWAWAHILARKEQRMQEAAPPIQYFALCRRHLQDCWAPGLKLL